MNRSADVQVRFEGGHPNAERKRAIVAPDYRVLDDEEMGIRLIEVSSTDDSLGDLDHGDYMGAILGLGIKRDKVGDIYVLPTGCHFLAAAEIADYIVLHLNQVHRVHVHTGTLPLDKLQATETKLDDMNLTVASLRLDGIVSDVYRLSRAKVLVPIKAGRCKVNWKQEEDPSKPLKQGDVVSLKGFGRFKVLEVEGLTKKRQVSHSNRQICINCRFFLIYAGRKNLSIVEIYQYAWMSNIIGARCSNMQEVQEWL